MYEISGCLLYKSCMCMMVHIHLFVKYASNMYKLEVAYLTGITNWQIIVHLAIAMKMVYKYLCIFTGAEVCCITLEILVFVEENCFDIYPPFSKIDTITYIEAQEYPSQ